MGSEERHLLEMLSLAGRLCNGECRAQPQNSLRITLTGTLIILHIAFWVGLSDSRKAIIRVSLFGNTASGR